MLTFLISFLFFFHALALDCKDPNAAKDPGFYNLCAKQCTTDQDCELIEYGCDNFAVNINHKDGFSEFLNSFPKRSCLQNFAKECLTSKCVKNSCILMQKTCNESKPVVSMPISQPAIQLSSSSSSVIQSNFQPAYSPVLKKVMDVLIDKTIRTPQNTADKMFKDKCTKQVNELNPLLFGGTVNLALDNLESYFSRNENLPFCNLYISFAFKNHQKMDLVQQAFTKYIPRVKNDEINVLIDLLVQNSQHGFLMVHHPSWVKSFSTAYDNETEAERKTLIFTLEYFYTKNFYISKDIETKKKEALFFYKNILLPYSIFLEPMDRTDIGRIYGNMYLTLNTEKKINLANDIASGKLSDANFLKAQSFISQTGMATFLKDHFDTIFKSKKMSNNTQCRYLSLLKTHYKEVYDHELKNKLNSIATLVNKCSLDFKSTDSLIKETAINDCTVSLFPNSNLPYNQNGIPNQLYSPIKNNSCIQKCETNEDCMNLAQKFCIVVPGNKKYANAYSSFLEKENPSFQCSLEKVSNESYRCENKMCKANTFATRDELASFFESVATNIKENRKLNQCQYNYQCTSQNFGYSFPGKPPVSITIGITSNFEGNKAIEEIKSQFFDKGASSFSYGVRHDNSPKATCINYSCAFIEFED